MSVGYPQAHDDDAQSAVRAGLGILAAMENLNARLRRDQAIQLAVRLGIHTGLVVVGTMGVAGRQEQLALGETPNIAARIQGLAEPNTLVISEVTHGLVHGYFDCEALGAHPLRGVSGLVAVSRVLSASGAHSRLDIARTRGLTPLVGRESEVTLLLERWAQVKDGQGQVVLLSGEGGIGKSRLVQVLKEHVAEEPHVRWECRSSPYYQNTALFPLTEVLPRVLRFQAAETPEARVGQLEYALSQYRLPVEETAPLLAPLLSLSLPENRYPLRNLSPQRQRQQTLEMLVNMLLEHAEQHPVLFIVEDLHWTDPTTLEFIDLLIDQTPTASMCVLLTCRPHFQPTWHHRSYLTEMTLHRLARHQVEWIAEQVAGGKPLPDQVLAQIVEKTDGVPLFVEEMTKALLEAGALQDVHGQYVMTRALSSFAIPATLHDALMARLDRLVGAKAVAQYAAVIGRQFPYALLHAVSQVDEVTLQRALGRLVEAEIVYQRGVPPQALYTFKHALIRDAAYQSLLKSTRQQYHQRIALVFEAQFPEIAETQPELVAHHYTEAGLTEQAVRYWQRAGQLASDRSAYLEAISHCTHGIALLQTLPETPEHTQYALTLHIALGAALLMTKGQAAPEVEHAYTQAYALCQQVGEAPELAPVLLGLWRHYLGRSQFHTARELGETLLRLAHRANAPVLAVIAHHALGVTWFSLGAFPAARQHLEEGIARDPPDQSRTPVFRTGQDSGVACRAYAAMTLWVLGYPAQALARLHEALTLAHTLPHPYSLAFARVIAARVAQWLRDVPAMHEQTEVAVTLATAQDFPLWVALGTSLHGWALAMQGQGEEGLAQIRQGIAAVRATGAALHVSSLYTLLAEVCDHLGHTEDGLQALAEAYTLVAQHEERSCEAEMHRLRGVLLRRQTGTPPAEAEAWLQRALDIARRQQAKSLELRAAMSLARLWQQQGKRDEAHALLAPVYGWFTEGFDTADLLEAKALLEELA